MSVRCINRGISFSFFRTCIFFTPSIEFFVTVWYPSLLSTINRILRFEILWGDLNPHDDEQVSTNSRHQVVREPNIFFLLYYYRWMAPQINGENDFLLLFFFAFCTFISFPPFHHITLPSLLFIRSIVSRFPLPSYLSFLLIHFPVPLFRFLKPS